MVQTGIVLALAEGMLKFVNEQEDSTDIYVQPLLVTIVEQLKLPGFRLEDVQSAGDDVMGMLIGAAFVLEKQGDWDTKYYQQMGYEMAQAIHKMVV